MKYCLKCLQPDTRPNTYFDEFGICPACNYYEKLKEVDWRERLDTLHLLLKSNKKKVNAKYDCIIGVSGGKDSTRQALWMRDKLDLKPLLVCLSYPPEQMTDRGAKNISNLINLGFDCIISSPAPETWRKLMRYSFLNFSNWAKSTELALFSSVPQLAIRYKIPLIFWGENPGLQLGDLKTLGKTGYDGNNLRNMNTLSGAEIQWLLDAGFSEKQINPYLYPSEKAFNDSNLKIIYLGWFLGDWSLINNAIYSVENGLKIREDSAKNTGDLYGVTSLDEDWVTLNQMIKYYKFGFGRATDYVNEEIRAGLISRDEGIKVVSEFDGACSPAYIKNFCEYIEISTQEFWAVIKKSLNPNLFEFSADELIKPKFKIGVGL